MKLLLSLVLLFSCTYSLMASPHVNKHDPNYKLFAPALANIPAEFIRKDDDIEIKTLSWDNCKKLCITLRMYETCYAIDSQSLYGFYVDPQINPDSEIWKNTKVEIIISPSTEHPYGEVMTHEYGHHIWYDFMTDEQRQLYINIWIQEDFTVSHPTDYAATNVREGFAEEFRLYIYHKNDLSSESIAYFDKLAIELKQPK